MGLVNILINFRKEVNRLLRSNTVRNAGFVFVGNLTGQGLGFLAMLVVLRNLGPAKFGLFSTAIAVMGLATQFSDLGISTGFVRYASLYLKEDQKKADLLFKITLYLKISVGLVILLIGLIIAKPLAVIVFRESALSPLLRIAFVGSLGATLWGYLQAILQAKEWFIKYAWINIFNNGMKVIGIVILLFFDQLSEKNTMLILALVPFVGFFIDGLIVPKHFLRTKALSKQSNTIFYELFHFSKWVTLASLFTMFISRIDIFMLQALSNSSQVGIYSGASQLATIFPIITSSITTSILPRVSSIKDRSDLIIFANKCLTLIPCLLILLTVLVLFAKPIIIFLFGNKYSMSINVFRLLIVSFVMGIFVNQLSLVAFNLNKIRELTLIIIIQLPLNILLDYWLIPVYGSIGAAISTLIIKLFGNIIIVFFILNILGIKHVFAKHS
jgi:O-antigen/teichoic acid export membrane protein